jgi:hypothetical protein
MASNAYTGRYKVKNPSKYKGDVHEVVFRSSWELAVFNFLDNNNEVVEWSSEEIVVPYLFEVDKKYHRYFVDVFIKWKAGNCMIVEIKPNAHTIIPKNKNKRSPKYLRESITYVKNQNKWAAAKEYALDRGWTFMVWTELELSEMGILPKPLKKVPGNLKKLKPYRPKKPRKPYK